VGALVSSGSVVQTLDRARCLVEPALQAAVDRLPAQMRTVAGYHFGWWDAAGAPIRAGAGKAIRPALVVLCAEAVGGAATAAVGAAVAVELVHNFSLLHDDIIDGDATRRHRAAAWTVYGTPAAILAGDSLLTQALRVLAASAPQPGPVVDRLCAALLELVAGESADVAFESRTDVGVDEYLEMAAGKTAALVACACELGALAGGGSPDAAERLRSFGHHLGLAFQMVDDLLGIWGDPQVTGKPVGADLRTRKSSLPVVAALTSETAAGRQFAALYARPEPLTDAQLHTAAQLVEEAGGRTGTEKQAHRQVALALSQLDDATFVPTAVRQLAELSHLVTDRDW